MTWQPMETAPKDGTEVLLYYRDWCGGGLLIISGEWDDSDIWDATWMHAAGTGDANAWMPIPEPPR